MMKTALARHWPGTLLAAALVAFAEPSSALNILLVNDDGLTSILQAQYEALTAAGYDVLVSMPCTNQSGKGASLSLFCASDTADGALPRGRRSGRGSWRGQCR